MMGAPAGRSQGAPARAFSLPSPAGAWIVAEGGERTRIRRIETMADTADVIIVGAGIMGASTAYHLARLGAGRVVVLERDTVCSGSTALASGGIRHQYGNRLGVELTTHSIVTYERFQEEFGVDPHFRQHGYLILIRTNEVM